MVELAPVLASMANIMYIPSAKLLASIVSKFSTSNSVSLYNKMDKFKMLDAYPNPTKLDINVKLFAPTQGNAQIVVRDIAGKVVYTHNQMTTAGVNLLTIDASNFAEGMYMILAIDAKTGASSTIKFIKD